MVANSRGTSVNIREQKANLAVCSRAARWRRTDTWRPVPLRGPAAPSQNSRPALAAKSPKNKTKMLF